MAVTLVLLFHLEPSVSAGPIFPSGWIGVDLFFVLSGFLITGILVDGEGQPNRLRNFYARRFLRIFPLYYLVLALMFGVVPLFTSDPNVVYPPGELPWYALYLQNLALPLIELGEPVSIWLSHTWSLAIEEQFYLVWPWLVLFLPRRLLVGTLVLVLVAAPVGRWLHLSERPAQWYAYWFVYKNTFLHVDGLAVGSLLALAVRSPRVSERALRVGGTAVALVLLPFSLWVLGSLRSGGEPVTHYPYTPTDPLVGTLTFTFLALGFGGLLVATLTLRARPLDWLLANPVALGVGRISYGIYVYHFPVILALRPLDPHPALPVAVTLALASVSWVAFERPILRLKARFPSGVNRA